MTSAAVRYEQQDEFAREPVRGLPELLPRGEEMLWQGAPSWQGLAASAYHARGAALYFALLLAWRLGAGLMTGESAASLVVSLLLLTGLAAAAVGTLVTLAVLAARTTVYTITNRRLVMRIGIALPMTLNLPFKAIVSASARTHPDGTADIPLQLAAQHRLAFLILWPHCRPWHLRKPEPMLRRVARGSDVAAILSKALEAYARTEAAAANAADAAPNAVHEPVRDTVAA
jgi:hypothetical protein